MFLLSEAPLLERESKAKSRGGSLPIRQYETGVFFQSMRFEFQISPVHQRYSVLFQQRFRALQTPKHMCSDLAEFPAHSTEMYECHSKKPPLFEVTLQAKVAGSYIASFGNQVAAQTRSPWDRVPDVTAGSHLFAGREHCGNRIGLALICSSRRCLASGQTSGQSPRPTRRQVLVCTRQSTRYTRNGDESCCGIRTSQSDLVASVSRS